MDYINNNRNYKTQERIKYILSKPYECHAQMKKFYQCVDVHQFDKKMDYNNAIQECTEFSYEGCLAENSKKIFNNRIFNTIKAAAEEEED